MCVEYAHGVRARATLRALHASLGNDTSIIGPNTVALRVASRHPVVGTSGIAVKNETEVPLLVVCSQLTPLHWGKGESDERPHTRSAHGPTIASRPPPTVLPGATWNEHNELGMGKVRTVWSR